MRLHVIKWGRTLCMLDAAASYKTPPHVSKYNLVFNLFTNILREYSLWIVNSKNISLLFNSDIVNFVLKTEDGEVHMGVGVQKAIFFLDTLIVGGWDVEGLGRKSYLGQAEITRFCLFRDVRVSSSFPCVTPGVDGVRPSVHRICSGRLFSFLFFAFFWGVGSWITLFFETTFPIIFLMLLNKTSDFTIYVAGCCPFFLWDCFFFFFF